jgi:glycosyltransferase involved in cell wall biosynthesis
MSSVLHEHWGYGRWVAATAVAYWLSGGAYYVVVGTLLSMRDVAALRALQNITLPFHQFVLAIGLLLLPWASGRYADGGQQGIHRVMRSTTFLYTACSVAYVACIVPFGHHMMYLLYGDKYMAFAYLLPLVCLPLPLSAIAQGPSVALKAMQSPADVFFAYTVSGFFTLAAGVGLTYVWGLVGALIGLALSSLSFLLVLSYRYRVKRAALVDPRPPINSCTREPKTKPSIRVAWLMPMFRYGYYWQPVLREFTRLLPDTLIYTCNWGGYTPACRNTFKVFEVSGTRLTFRRKPSSYDVGLTSAPFSLILSLLRFRPDLIVTTQFGLWTVFGLIVKLLLRARMILLWDGISPGIACMQSPLRLASRRFLARYFDICVTQTRDAFEYLRDTVNVPEPKIVLRPYEVPDIAVLCADEHICGPADDLPKPLFLYVGSLSERKGVKYLIESVRRLHARNVGLFSVALVGDGDIELLRKMVAKYNLSGHIHFAGRVPYQELGHWFRACDAFVLPTLEDVWGMVVLEAMAFGKPVLCSRHAGSSELVHPGINGFLFDPLRPIELTALMAHLIEHPHLLGRFGERSKELVASLTPQSSAALLRDLILRTIGNPPGGQSGLTECHEQAKAVSAD